MSSGASTEYEKPRSGRSTCIDDTPRSSSTTSASTAFEASCSRTIENSPRSSRAWSEPKRRWNLSKYGRTLGSRSIAIRRPRPRRSSASSVACPPPGGAIPDLQMIMDADDDDIPAELRVFAQMRRNDHAALPVEVGLGRGPEEVPPQAPPRLAERIHLGESRLDGSSPILTTVGEDAAVEPARENRPVCKGLTELGGKSEPMLVIDRVLVLAYEQPL